MSSDPVETLASLDSTPPPSATTLVTRTGDEAIRQLEAES
jgi:hypothetical protein